MTIATHFLKLRLFVQRAGIKIYFAVRKRAAIANFWGGRHLSKSYWSRGLHWGQIPAVHRYTNRRISGDPKIDFVEYTQNRYLRPMRAKGEVHILSFCSGIGQTEIGFFERGLCDSITGYEVSLPSVERANETALKKGLSKHVKFVHADLNTVEFPTQRKYNVFLNEAALHHISDLEHLMRACKKVATQDAIFINHDFVGANHHQWTTDQLFYINKILAFLPPELRISRSSSRLFYHTEKKPLPLNDMLRIDPSEAVRSEETKKVMRDYFDIIEERDFGGSILHMLLNDMAGNFCAKKWQPLVDLLILFEETLIDKKILGSDFSFWVAVPKP